MSKTGSPALKQPTYYWKATDKYIQLWNIEIKVKDIFMT